MTTDKPVLSASTQIDGQRKPIILTFVRHYLPGYKCGPIRSIANMADQLGDRFDLRIVTLDRDLGDAVSYPGIEADGRWRDVSSARVLYLPPGRAKLALIRKALGEPHDVLYLNSFFDPVFTILPLVLRRLRLVPGTRTIIAPRGEFSAGALSLKSTKKRCFMFVARLVRLYQDLVWQASSEFEQDDIRRVMAGVADHVHVAPDLLPVATRPVAYVSRAENAPLRLCFLSRISPKKNLLFAIDLLRSVRTPVQFDIYGPVEDQVYWRRCEAAIKLIPPHHSVRWHGSVERENVAGVLAGHDLFFLPTLGENFGYVIHEALSAGTPVLIARTTPWRDIEARGAGWDLSLDQPELFRDAIEQMYAMSPDQLREMRERARAFSQTRWRASDLLAATTALLSSASGNSEHAARRQNPD